MLCDDCRDLASSEVVFALLGQTSPRLRQLIDHWKAVNQWKPEGGSSSANTEAELRDTFKQTYSIAHTLEMSAR